MMIDLFEHRRKRGFDIRKIHDPSALRTRFAGYVNLDPERVPVQPRAFVSRRYVRKAMRSFDLENFEDIHFRIRGSAAGTRIRVGGFVSWMNCKPTTPLSL